MLLSCFPSCFENMSNELTYDLVIVGAGHAGRNAARSARAANDVISIALVGEEVHLPYERPALSKDALLVASADASLIAGAGAGGTSTDTASDADAAAYKSARIDVYLGHCVTGVDTDTKTVVTANGRTFHFGRAILATGSRVRTLPATLTPGFDTSRLFYLRTRDDAMRLDTAMLDARHVVVIGAGFIGLEVACAARTRGIAVTVIDFAPRILGRVFPGMASTALERLHRANGVELLLDTSISGISHGPDERVSVATTAGTLVADLIVVGIGVVPNVELAREAGLHVEDGIVVDAHGCTSHADIFAAGEVTRHPAAGFDTPQRLESWQVAEMQANAAGASAAGQLTPYDAIPWFWSDQFNVNIQCLGNIAAPETIVTRGDPSGAHSLFFLNATQQVAGLIAINNGKDVSATRRVMRAGMAVDPILLADDTVAWRTIMAANKVG
jgi:anthranilate 1,2-dioxygenase ferredoxin reductase subunit